MKWVASKVEWLAGKKVVARAVRSAEMWAVW